jgi:TonB C terminal
VSYIGEVRERAYAFWQPSDAAAAGPVVIAFQIDERGNVVYSEVRSSPTPTAGEEARHALLAAAPYASMPEAAKCLAERKLVATFSLPSGSVPAVVTRTRSDSRFYIVMGAALAAPLLFLVGLFWWMNRRREDPSSPADEREVIALQPGEEVAFFRSRLTQGLELLVPLHALPLFQHGPWVFALIALIDAAVLYGFWQRRNTPLVRISSAEIESAPPLAPAKQLMTHELASWAATRSLLVLRSVRGEELPIALNQLSAADQRRILAIVRGLPRASSPEPPLTARHLERRQWRRTAWAMALVVVTMALTLWFVFRLRG